MRRSKIVIRLLLSVLMGMGLPLHASTSGFQTASKMSAALGGPLDSELGEAGALTGRVDSARVVLRLRRTDEFRHRVVREDQLVRATLAGL